MKQFVVIGCGRFGTSVAKTLYTLGNEVMIIDTNEEVINKISDYVTYAVQGDASDEKTLKSLGVRNFDVAVIAMGADIQSSILISIMLKEMGVKKIVAKAQNDLHARVLSKIGVDKIVFPERDMGVKIAQSLISSNIMDYIELSPEYSVVEINVLDEWVGKTLIELDMRSKYGINIMAIKKDSFIDVSPDASHKMEKNSMLIVIGHNKDIKKLEKKI